jgi:predicted ester cyclase
VLELYRALRGAFDDFAAMIHWQSVEEGLVTTFKIYQGTHTGTFLGVPPTGNLVRFETLDAMRVVDGRIVEHWGVANLLSAMRQIGVA